MFRQWAPQHLSHEAAGGNGFTKHCKRQRTSGQSGPIKPTGPKSHRQEQTQRQQTNAGAFGDGTGVSKPNQNALVEPAVRNGPRPRRHPLQRAAGRLQGLRRRPHQVPHDDIKEWCERHRNMHHRANRRQSMAEEQQPAVRRAIGAQLRAGRKQHDDRRLDQNGQRERKSAVPRELRGGIGKLGHGTHHEWIFDRHQQPAEGEGNPITKNIGGPQRACGLHS